MNEDNSKAFAFELLSWFMLISLSGFLLYTNITIRSQVKDKKSDSTKIDEKLEAQLKIVIGLNSKESLKASAQQQYNILKTSLADSPYQAAAIMEFESQEKALEYLKKLDDDSHIRILTVKAIKGSLNDAEKKVLTDSGKWVGEFLCADEKQKTVLRQQAYKAAMINMGFTIIALVGVIAGIALLINAISKLKKNKWKAAFERQEKDKTSVMIFFFSSVAVFLFFSTSIAAAKLRMPIPPVALQMIMLFFIVLSLNIYKGEKTKELYGLQKTNVGKEIAMGFYGYLAGLPILCLGLMVSAFLVKVTGMQADHPIGEMVKNASTAQIMMMVFMACIAAPILEELIFRGGIYSHLRTKSGFLFSALISAFIFAAIHPQGISGLPVLTAIGFNLACIREWRGSIIAPITAHMINNSIAMGVTILFHS